MDSGELGTSQLGRTAVAKQPSVLLLVNQRSARADSDVERGIETLEARGIAVETMRSTSIAESRAAIGAAHLAGASCILIAGGDGTLNQLVDAVLETGLPVAIVPLGTANVLARTLDLPRDPEQACLVAAEGVERRIDVGRVNGRAFLSVASLGLSSRVARESTPKRKRRLGPLTYVFAAASAAFAARPFDVEVELADRCMQLRVIQLDIANGHHLGDQRIEADSEPDDGMLTITALRAQSRWRLLVEIWRLWRGGAMRKGESLIFRAPRVVVRTRRPVSIDTDGEPGGSTPAVFEVVPRQLAVLVPKDGDSRPRASNGGGSPALAARGARGVDRPAVGSVDGSVVAQRRIGAAWGASCRKRQLARRSVTPS